MVSAANRRWETKGFHAFVFKAVFLYLNKIMLRLSSSLLEPSSRQLMKKMQVQKLNRQVCLKNYVNQFLVWED
jgi:hypothetical protein